MYKGGVYINTLKITKEILNLNNITAKKKFGQNFLIDDEILENIVQVADIKKDELIIEIGPGLGNLTDYILKETNNFLGIEIDNDMIDVLKNRFDDVNILNMDVLKTDIDDEIEKLENIKKIKYSKVKVIANLPYYITSPIIFKLLQNSKKINELYVMVQLEVANRIIAKPRTKDYGILTVMTEFYGNCLMEIIVPNTSFIPSPNVTSAVVSIKKHDKFKDTNFKIFNELVHKAFATRRKKAINSLSINNFLNMPKQDIESLFTKCNVDLNSRAEELVLQKYLEITKECDN